jgi:hypothetical protein
MKRPRLHLPHLPPAERAARAIGRTAIYSGIAPGAVIYWLAPDSRPLAVAFLTAGLGLSFIAIMVSGRARTTAPKTPTPTTPDVIPTDDDEDADLDLDRRWNGPTSHGLDAAPPTFAHLLEAGLHARGWSCDDPDSNLAAVIHDVLRDINDQWATDRPAVTSAPDTIPIPVTAHPLPLQAVAR